MKPTKHTKEYYLWGECAKHIETVLTCSLRRSGHDFWLLVLERADPARGSFFSICDEWSDLDVHPDTEPWQVEIIDAILAEFGEVHTLKSGLKYTEAEFMW